MFFPSLLFFILLFVDFLSFSLVFLKDFISIFQKHKVSHYFNTALMFFHYFPFQGTILKFFIEFYFYVTYFCQENILVNTWIVSAKLIPLFLSLQC